MPITAVAILPNEVEMSRGRRLQIAERIAKGYAALGAAILLAFVIGAGIFGNEPWPPNFSQGDGFLFALFPVGVTIGLILGLWRGRIGGWIATICLVSFYVSFLIIRGDLPGGPFFVLFSAGGPMLVLVDWAKGHSG